MANSISILNFSYCFFFSSRRRHTRFDCDWSSDVCSSDLGAEGLAAEHFADHGVEPAVLEGSFARPRIILAGAQIERLKFLRPVVFKKWIRQAAGPVLAPEKHAQRMLYELRVATKTAADSQAAVLLETARIVAVGVNQLERHGAFPIDAVLKRVGVNPRGGIEQVPHLGHDRHRRDLAEDFFP